MNPTTFRATPVQALTKFVAAVAACSLWLMAGSALAQSGQFTYVIGSVTIERGSERIVPIRGTEVQPLDVIVTGADGMAQLSMVDQAKLSLRSKSKLIVQQYPTKPNDPGVVLVLVNGTLRSFTGLLTGPQKAGYRMNTKVATVGIRGSGGIIEHEGETTNVHTIEGSYLVASIDGKFPPVLTNPNQTVQVVQGQAPKVVPTPPSLLESSKVTVAAKEDKPPAEEKPDATNPGTGTGTGGSGSGSGSSGGNSGTTGTAGPVSGGNGLGFAIVDATGNLGADPVNLQSVVIVAGGATISDLAIPAGMTLDASGGLRGYTAYAGSQSGTGANTTGGTARDIQTVTVGGNTTIVIGRWESPASFGFGAGNGGGGGTVGGSVHWAYGGAGFPAYLSDVLTGSASYTRQAATTPTNQLGLAGTLTTSVLDVNFSARTLSAAIGVTMPTNGAVPGGTWNLSASNVPFSFNSFYAADGRVVVTNGSGASSTSNPRLGGSIEGSFVGNTLNGAILGYSLFDQSSATTANFQRISGVVAFSGPSQNAAAPYRDGIISDPTGVLNAASFIRSFTTTDAQAEVNVGASGAVTAFTAPYASGNELVGHRPYAQGTATIVDNGFDPATGLVWGRWAGGTATIGGQTVNLAGNSLHYIFSPTQSGPVSLPLTGSAVYDVVGSTRPTNSAGAVGVFNSATLNANFSSRTVDTSVNITIAGQTWNGAASGVPIYRDQYFSAYAGGPTIPGVPRPAAFNITCTPNCTPGLPTGSIDGFFTGRSGGGAGVMYNMSGNAGAVAFARRGG